jgi:hypothetical protein
MALQALKTMNGIYRMDAFVHIIHSIDFFVPLYGKILKVQLDVCKAKDIGLSFYIACLLVEVHGGCIWMASEVGNIAMKPQGITTLREQSVPNSAGKMTDGTTSPIRWIFRSIFR